MTFDDTWTDASIDGPADEAPPDGTHDVALIDAGAFTSKAGNDVAKLEFRTVDGEYTWSMILGFANPKQTGFSKSTCARVGVDVDEVLSLPELDAALKTRIGGYFEVKVERNGEYVNTYVNDGAVPPDVPAPGEPDFQPAATDDEPIPF